MGHMTNEMAQKLRELEQHFVVKRVKKKKTAALSNKTKDRFHTDDPDDLCNCRTCMGE